MILWKGEKEYKILDIETRVSCLNEDALKNCFSVEVEI